MGIIRRHLSSKVNWIKINKLGILGIDEISLKKGHKDFVAIITSKVEGELVILAVLKDRLKKTVKDFLLSIPKRLRRTVKAVCSDMYEGFIKMVYEFCKELTAIFDENIVKSRAKRKFGGATVY